MVADVFRDSGDYFVSLRRGAEEIDVAGPFFEASEALDMARRWTPCVSVDCPINDDAPPASFYTDTGRRIV